MNHRSQISAVNNKYSDLMAELYLDAVRGNITTYDELFSRYDTLNRAYQQEMVTVGGNETEINVLFRENAINAQKRGESVHDYAFFMCNVINTVEFLDIDMESLISDRDESDDSDGDPFWDNILPQDHDDE